jgi:uncharacterized membrane protein
MSARRRRRPACVELSAAVGQARSVVGPPAFPHESTGSPHRWILPVKLPEPINPALIKEAEQRAGTAQNRIADRITTFSGSMAFVYIHVIWFGCWIGFGVEKYPFGLLTMIVSLEAIFLSTFVMISQNRADGKRQALADHQWRTVREEERQNHELIDLSNQILGLTKEIRSFAKAQEDNEQNKELLGESRQGAEVP